MIKRFFKSVRHRFSKTFAEKGRKSQTVFSGGSVRDDREEQNGESSAVASPGSSNNETSFPPEKVEQQNDNHSAIKPKRAKKKRWQLSDFEVEPAPGKVRFHEMHLPLPVMHGIAELGFRYCTPVQAESLPHLLEGKDLIGNANTGTGKTAVFLITILTKLLREKKEKTSLYTRALIIAPTRELVIQITKDGRQLSKYANIRIASVYGGTDYKKQMDFVEKKRCDIIVATPGRLLDFCRKNVVKLKECQTLVIDEADRMLDMGFIPDVRRIVSQLPDKEERQTLLFSATITDEVKRLAYQWCNKPVNVAIEPEQVAVESVDQKVYLVTSAERYPVLYNLIQKNQGSRMAVFTNQKIEAKKLHDRLQRNGINCTLLSGDIPQDKRTRRLESFRSGQVPILVATDVAGRGIHIEGITHVVNYTLPYEPEDYVHRIGRTGRAGALGVSVSFACEEESFVLPDIEEYIGRKLDCFVPEDDLLTPPPKGTAQKAPQRKSGPGRKRRSAGSRRSQGVKSS
jgi:ATP-dependent RNA helicase RhlB